jgi:AcrR family transcriptional regulator
MAKKDLRSVRTVARIERAFIDLLQEKSFDQVKVSELARKADIDRQTFYLHYVDKYDLLAKMNCEFIEEHFRPIILERLRGGDNFALEKMEHIYQENLPYLKENRQKILSLLAIDTGRICLKRDLKQFMIKEYQAIMHVNLTQFQQEIIATLYVETFITVIKENRTISRKEIEELFDYLRSSIS